MLGKVRPVAFGIKMLDTMGHEKVHDVGEVASVHAFNDETIIKPSWRMRQLDRKRFGLLTSGCSGTGAVLLTKKRE